VQDTSNRRLSFSPYVEFIPECFGTVTLESSNVKAKRFGLFRSIALVGKNVVKLELPGQLRIHPVVHVIHTMLHFNQPLDISSPVLVRPTPVPTALGSEIRS
jgi:hypothetical protein